MKPIINYYSSGRIIMARPVLGATLGKKISRTIRGDQFIVCRVVWLYCTMVARLLWVIVVM